MTAAVTKKRSIERSDILDAATYAAARKARRAEIIAMKKNRRVHVGPHLTLYFECYETMLYQVQEMLHAEGGGEEQLQDELLAYNPLIPQGNELSATLMIEVNEPVQRARLLDSLGGIEEHVSLRFGGETVQATWENDVDRTTPDGKTSSVHFLHFHMTAEQAAAFAAPGTEVIVAVTHPNYTHMAGLREDMRAELTRDL